MIEDFILSRYGIDKKHLGELEDAKNFAIIWNIFEYKCCGNNARIGKHPEYLSGKLLSLITEDELEAYWQYFKKRYVNDENNRTNEKFDSSLFKNTSFEKDLQEKARSVLLNGSPSVKEKINCLLLISFRVRNNFFHGEKSTAHILEQNDLFIHVSEFLILIINKY